MCDLIARVAGDTSLPASSRRRFLQVVGGAAGASLAVAGCGPAAIGASSPTSAVSSTIAGGASTRTRLVLLGTAGGPALFGGDRCGISTAIVYQDRVYLVDLGYGAFRRLRESGLSGPQGMNQTLNSVRGVFFTHMHSDHLMDWPAVYGTGQVNAGGRTGEPIAVFGPGDRGTLARVFPPDRPAPQVFNPAQPTPGIVGMSRYLKQAWAYDFNDRARDSVVAGPDALFQVQDIDISNVWSPDPQGVPPRLKAPIPVWQDGDVAVTATLVDHHPTAPAFAFRFDTPDGSVTVSGDTTVSENLIALARDTDYLVHEVIDPAFVERVVATLPAEQSAAARAHLLEAHTTIEQVGRDVAEPAGAKNLVLSHLAPGNAPDETWHAAQNGYSGRLIVGKDLMELIVG